MHFCSAFSISNILYGLGCSSPAPLLTPVQPISPKPIRFPSGVNSTECTYNSRTPSWVVNNLYYQRVLVGPSCVTPSGQCPPGKLYYGDVEFDLVNQATGDARHCGALWLGLNDVYNQYQDWLACDAWLVFFPPTPTTWNEEHKTMTYFRFNHSTNTLMLNQTWYCANLGEGDAEYGFSAAGAVSPALDPGVHYVGDMTVPEIRVNASASSLRVLATAVIEKHLGADNLE
jgi:hypothetical protein